MGYKLVGCNSKEYKTEIYDNDYCSATTGSYTVALPDCTNEFALDYEIYDSSCTFDNLKESSSSVCFSGDSSVVTSSGAVKRVSDIQVGDAVQALTSDGDTVFADVVFVVHEQNIVRSKFVNLKIANGNVLRVTPEHLLPSGACFPGASVESMNMIRAELIHVGDCVMTPQGPEQVVSVAVTEGQGVYSFVTSETSGLVIVDGIAASSFGFSHSVVNSYYHLHRAIYYAGGASILGSQLVRSANALFGEAAVYMGRILRLV